MGGSGASRPAMQLPRDAWSSDGVARVVGTRWLMVLAGLSVLVGMALRVFHVGERALVFDEGYTWALARRPFAEMLGLFSFEANGALYPVLLWPILRVNETEEAIRSVALVFGLGAVAATYFAALTMLRDRRAAVFAVVLVSVSPLAIQSSQAAKGSSLSLALVAASYGLLALSLRSGAWRHWFLYGLLIVLVGYASNTGLLALAGQPIMALQERARARRWVATLGVAAVALLPLGYITYRSARERDSLYWETQPTLGEAARVVQQLVVGEAEGTRAGRIVFFLTCCAAVLVIAFGIFGKSRLGRPTLRAMIPLLAWAVAPMIALLLVSQVKPIFDIRYLVASLPAVCIVGGALLARAPPRFAVGVSGVLVVAFGLVYGTTDYTTTDHRTVGRWLSARSDGTEPVLVVPVEQLPALAYYATSLRDARGGVVVEEWGDSLPSRIVGYRLPGGYGDAPTAPPTVRAVEHLAAEGRFFVISYPRSLGAEVDAWLARHCKVDRSPLAQLKVEGVRCR